MSMILGLVTLSDANIAKVLRDPRLIWRVVAPNDPDAGEESEPSGIANRLFARFRGPKPAPIPLEFEQGEMEATDLDKAWDGLHFLFTGNVNGGDGPLAFLHVGGVEVGTPDVGYCPARAVTAREVAEIHAAMRGLDEDMLRARFDPERMTREKVYPVIWDRPPEEDDSFGYLMEYFRVLRQFLARAAGRNLGVVITLE
jgi:hypothetical protein